jgi:hypothetical protein
MVHPPIQDDE